MKGWPSALVIAAGVHALHGFVALALGLAGIVEGLMEAHVPASDWQLFAALVVLGPALAAWTALAARSASAGVGRGWLVSRGALTALLLVVYLVGGISALGLAGSGGLGAGFFAVLALGACWLALPEARMLGAALAIARRVHPAS